MAKLNTSDNPVFNISFHLKEMAGRYPFRRAVVYPAFRDKNGLVAYTHLTFEQLDHESDHLAYGLNSIGIVRGTRTIMMVKPGIDFFILTFALFKAGAVPVVVDPGMGLKRMLLCLKESDPEAFIGVPAAHMLRIFFPKYFKTVKTCITAGKRWFWGGHSLSRLRRSFRHPAPLPPTHKKDTAAVLFTTGSTGPAKGALYTHQTFDAQIRHIKSCFDFSDDEIDLPTFPLFALFDPALGITAVIPDMDPTKPALVNSEKIIEAIISQGVTNMFASPALLDTVGKYGKKNQIKLPSLRRVISAGAPVSPANLEQFSSMLSDSAQIFTPYGATEAVPIISIGSKEIFSETVKLTEKGYGICIGRPVNGLDVQIIRISDRPLETWSDDLVLENGEIGEITVKGELVSEKYYKRPKADALAKIYDEDRIWHRMGDLGWQDNKGRIWFCGRKNHRVITEKGTMFTIPCEGIFNKHPDVSRSALVGIGKPPKQKPVICIELKIGEKRKSKKKVKEELLKLAGGSVLTEDIDIILFNKAFPVDIRHNSKIFREKLAVWAQKQIKGKDFG